MHQVALSSLYHSDPRPLSCSWDACGFWVRCLSWIAENTPNDHYIPLTAVQEIAGDRTDELTSELVKAGLLIPEQDGFRAGSDLYRIVDVVEGGR